jgi:hypothetical protein
VISCVRTGQLLGGSAGYRPYSDIEHSRSGDLRAYRCPNPTIDVRLCRERAFHEATKCVTPTEPIFSMYPQCQLGSSRGPLGSLAFCPCGPTDKERRGLRAVCGEANGAS